MQRVGIATDISASVHQEVSTNSVEFPVIVVTTIIHNCLYIICFKFM